MKRTNRAISLVLVIAALILGVTSDTVAVDKGRDLTIVSTTPSAYSSDIAAATQIEVQFSETINSGTVTASSFAVYGSLTGYHSGGYLVDGSTVTFTADDPFALGERTTTTLTTGISSSGGSNLVSPHVWSFTIEGGESGANFVPGEEFELGYTPWRICTADFNGDGLADIAAGTYERDSVFFYINDGTGSLLDGQRIEVAGGLTDIVILDMEPDGDVDVVCICDYYDISVLKNTGSGTFTRDFDVNFEYQVGQSVTADFNGDGLTDLAVGQPHGFTKHISVLLNNGAASFDTPVVYEFEQEYVPALPMACDTDLDGDLDIVGFSSGLIVFENDGNGSFSSPTTSSASHSSVGHDVADFNDDGYPDFAISGLTSGDGYYSVMLNNQDNTFSQTTPVAIEGNTWDVEVSDLNGDGILDLAIVLNNPDVNHFAVLLGSGGYSFELDGFYTAGDYVMNSSLADYDGDGDIDAIIGNRSSEDLSIRYNMYCVDTDGDGFGDPGHPQNECPLDNCPSIFNPDQIDSDIPPDGVGDACSWTEVVPAGTWLDAYFDDAGIQIIFPQVFSPGGEVTLEVVHCGPGSWPTGFQIQPSSLPLCFDIEVDFTFLPPVDVCFYYDGSEMTPFEEQTMTVQHWKFVDWEILPITYHDPDNDYICAATNTFSTFALAIPLDYVCGDADASGAVDIDDVVYLINYIFTGGPEPVPYESGDANCSAGVDIDDVVWLIAYIFTGGYAPCDTNGDEVPDC